MTPRCKSVPVLLQVPGKSSATLTPDNIKHILQVTPAAWTKTNSQSTLQTMANHAPALGTSPLVPTLLDQGHLPTKIWLYLLLCVIPWLAPFHRGRNDNIFSS